MINLSTNVKYLKTDFQMIISELRYLAFENLQIKKKISADCNTFFNETALKLCGNSNPRHNFKLEFGKI
jgi:hypothetical protein